MGGTPCQRLQHVEKIFSQTSPDHISLSLFPQQQQPSSPSSTAGSGASASSHRSTTTTNNSTTSAATTTTPAIVVPPSHLQPKFLPSTPSVCVILDHLQYEADLLHKKIAEVDARIKDANGAIKKSTKTLKKKLRKSSGSLGKVGAAKGSKSKKKGPVSHPSKGVARGTKRTTNTSRSTTKVLTQKPTSSKQVKGGGGGGKKAPPATTAAKGKGGPIAVKKKGSGGISLLQLALQNAARKTTAASTNPDAPKQLSVFDIRRGYYYFLYRKQLQLIAAGSFPQPPPLPAEAATQPVEGQAGCAEVDAEEGAAASTSSSSSSSSPAAASSSSSRPSATVAGLNDDAAVTPDDATATTTTTNTPTPTPKRTKGPLAALMSKDRDLLGLKAHPIANMNKMELERARYLFETTFNRYYSFPPTSSSSSSLEPPESIQRLLGHSPADVQCARIWQRLDGYEPSHFLGVDALLMYMEGLMDGSVMDGIIRHKSAASTSSSSTTSTTSSTSNTNLSTTNTKTKYQDLYEKLHYMETLSIDSSDDFRGVYSKVSPILFQCLSDNKGCAGDVVDGATSSFYDRLSFDFNLPYRSRTAPTKATIALFPPSSTTSSNKKKVRPTLMGMRYFSHLHPPTQVLTTTLKQFPLPTPPIALVPTPPPSQQQQEGEVVATVTPPSSLPSSKPPPFPPSSPNQLFNEQAVKIACSLSYLITSLKELIRMCYITTTTSTTAGGDQKATTPTTGEGATPAPNTTTTTKLYALLCQSEAKKCGTLLPTQKPLQLSSSTTSLSAFSDFLTGTRCILPNKHLNTLKAAPLPSTSNTSHQQQQRLTPTSSTPVGRLQSGVRRMQSAPAKPLPKRAAAAAVVRRPAPKKKKAKRVWDDDDDSEESSEDDDAESSSSSDASSSSDDEDEDTPPRRKPAPKKGAAAASTTSTTGKKKQGGALSKVLCYKQHQQRVAQLTAHSEDAPLISHLLSSKVVSASRSSVGKKKPGPKAGSAAASKKVAVAPPKKTKKGGAAKKKKK